MIVRKTFFDDCKGERFQELLLSFSTLVLRKVLAAGQGRRPCLAARLATAKTVTAKEQRSLLPLAVAHRASLTAILHKKKDLRERYQKFGRILNAKEQELDRRFEAVVSTQDLLDKNPIPDQTVARVSKLFEKNWQGDRKPVEVITQGEAQGMKDSLLDKPFSETWLQVSAGTFDGATGTSWQGLLQDLEERVANQEARSTDWRKFRDAMKTDEQVTSVTDNTTSRLIQTRSKDTDHQEQRDLVFSPRKSPRKSDWKAGEEASPTHPKPSRKENTQDELRERDRVFSPRKSMWPVEDLEAEISPAHSRASLKQNETENVATQKGNLDDGTGRVARSQLFEIHKGDTTVTSPHISSEDDTDESGFSEISDGQLYSIEPLDQEGGTIKNPRQYSYPNEVSSIPNNEKVEPESSETRVSDTPRPSDHPRKLFTKKSSPAASDDDDSCISYLQVGGIQENRIEPQSPDEDDKLAEQIVSMTINAAPTPAKPKASLMERTRQSMAFASPVGLQNLLPEGPAPSPFPPILSKPPHLTTDPSAPRTLLERTRQSISLVPSKPKGSRKSMLDRRTSKPYPTNQFETPKRQLHRVTELTPPEELFSPGAGYDSVFKSRPKIALSPNPSPKSDEFSERDDAEGERGGDDRVGREQRDQSPSARMNVKV